MAAACVAFSMTACGGDDGGSAGLPTLPPPGTAEPTTAESLTIPTLPPFDPTDATRTTVSATPATPPSSSTTPSRSTRPSTTPNTTAPETSAVDDDSPFPLSVDPSNRFLVDHQGRPFLIHGDTAWSLIAELDEDEAIRYLDDRRARGFNTLLVSLLEHKFTTNAPNNAAGEPPFASPGDYTSPNEAYMAHADWVLEQAELRGFAVLLTPSYIGYVSGNEGWYSEMAAAGTDALEGYGRYLAERFADRRNIIWVHGGDDDPPDPSLSGAIADGISEVDADILHTAHGKRDSSPSEFWDGAAWLDLSNVYTYDDVVSPSAAEYERGDRPFFFLEGMYENEHGVSTQVLRTQAYQALLTGAAGQVFGNNPIWHLSGPGLFPAPTDWVGQLDSPGTQGMQHVAELFGGLQWWTLVPDLDQTILTGDLGDKFERSVAAVTSDGAVAIAYLPTDRDVQIDLRKLTADTVTITWFDPSNGARLAAGEPVATSGQFAVTTPGENAAGDSDWVLVVEAA